MSYLEGTLDRPIMNDKEIQGILDIYSDFTDKITDILFDGHPQLRFFLIQQENVETLRKATKWVNWFVPDIYYKEKERTGNKLESLGVDKKKKLNDDIKIQKRIRIFMKYILRMHRSIIRIVKLFDETELKANETLDNEIVKLASIQSFSGKKVDFRQTEIGREVKREVRSGLTVLKRYTREGYAYRGTLSRGEIQKNLKKLFKEMFGELDFIEIRLKKGGIRRYNVNKYIKMVARTEMRHITTQGMLQESKERENDLVIISNHAGICVSHVCDSFEGNVYSISGKHPDYPKLIEEPPYHPNCKHSLHAITDSAINSLKKHGLFQSEVAA